MASPTLIFCAAGNKRYSEIAIDMGLEYGARLPHTIYYPPYFVDQNWQKPNRDKYMAALNRWRPFMASVIDWEYLDQLPEVLNWAEEIAEFVTVVMIIPKVQNGVKLLPKNIGGKSIRLGYSIPTKYGSTNLMVSEFNDWPVHLLGGSPKDQFDLTHYLNVISIDGNAMMKAAQYGNFWNGKKWQEIHTSDKDFPYECFRRSCEGIKKMWGIP